MKIRPAFWTALFAGMAAPSMLLAPNPSYTALIRDFSAPSSFGRVGVLLTNSMRNFV